MDGVTAAEEKGSCGRRRSMAVSENRRSHHVIPQTPIQCSIIRCALFCSNVVIFSRAGFSTTLPTANI